MDIKQVERVYSSYARIYDRIFGRIFQESRESAIRSLNVRPDERVLEVGVGTGLTLPLYPRHCELLAIDLSAAMLAKARERVRAHELTHVQLVQMDAGRMSLRDDSFDTVIAAYVVTAVPDCHQLLREMARVCRPGGRIVMLNHFVNGSSAVRMIVSAISPLCKHIGFRTDLSLEDVLDGTPLVVDRHQKVKPFGMWHLLECWNRKSRAAGRTRPSSAGALPRKD